MADASTILEALETAAESGEGSLRGSVWTGPRSGSIDLEALAEAIAEEGEADVRDHRSARLHARAWSALISRTGILEEDGYTIRLAVE